MGKAFSGSGGMVKLMLKVRKRALIYKDVVC